MEKSLVDVPVALVFFNRDDTLKPVFEQVKKARPSKLFLIQDGARESKPDDTEGILKCREIVEDIDWECEVYKNYSDENLGCGRRVSSGISWAFQHVDRLVIVEDDCVVEPTFFEFCRELLEKYKDDERISMISALNHFGEWDCGGSSYFFCKTGAIAAWATWKRVWDSFDFKVEDFDDAYVRKLIFDSVPNKRVARTQANTWQGVREKDRNGEQIRFWGPQYAFLKYKSTALGIVPSHSLSCNIGVGGKATFSGSGVEFMRKPMRGWFFQKTRPMEFPLVHPKAMLPDTVYDKKYYSVSSPNVFIRTADKIYYTLKRRLYSLFKK